jgi:protein TonB
MQQSFHLTAQPGARWSNERIVGVSFVALLHVIAIWAILNGLVQKIIPKIEPPPITWLQPAKPILPTQPAPRLPHVDPTDHTTRQVIAPLPTFTIDDGQPHGGGTPYEAPQQPTTPDTFVSGIGGTHTIPVYPPLARRLGEQGSVRLSITISAAGDVTGANVVQSSGFPDLDQTAVDWVVSHWKYKPATHAGIAVPSQTLANLMFNLQNAR